MWMLEEILIEGVRRTDSSIEALPEEMSDVETSFAMRLARMQCPARVGIISCMIFC